jgi:hypothetical protein
MQESYGEGLAAHTGPESCAAVREALTGGRAGRVFSRERQLLRDADAVEEGGRPHPRRRYRETPRPGRGSTVPGTVGTVPQVDESDLWAGVVDGDAVPELCPNHSRRHPTRATLRREIDP